MTVVKPGGARLCAALAAKRLCVEQIIVMGCNEGRLELARRLGVNYTVASRGEAALGRTGSPRLPSIPQARRRLYGTVKAGGGCPRARSITTTSRTAGIGGAPSWLPGEVHRETTESVPRLWSSREGGESAGAVMQ